MEALNGRRRGECFGVRKHNGLKQTTPSPSTVMHEHIHWLPRPNKTALGLAAALTTVAVVVILGFGQLSYAATSVTRAVQQAVRSVSPGQPAVAPLSSAAGQYGEKVAVCTVQSNGQQHTTPVSKSVEAAYLAEHPTAFAGSCGPFRPHGVTANVCITIRRTHQAAVYVTAGQLAAYLKRNHGSYTTKTGKCIRR
jgi:hypothetical protein